MYIEIDIVEDENYIANQDYHDRLIAQFKNEYDYAFNYIECKTGNVEVRFTYNPTNQRFTLVALEKLRHVHNYLMRSDAKISKWFDK